MDDDPDVSTALAWLLGSLKIDTRSFQSGEAFLRELATFKGPACAVLDLRMPEINGLELLQRMNDSGYRIPVLFLSAHGDIPAAVNALHLGAIDFLQKPFNPQTFLDSVGRAIKLARELHEKHLLVMARQVLLSRISERENEVLQWVLRGQTSKEIARVLGISPRTVDVHRAKVMRKVGVATILGLINKFREN
ncbi:MAG: response regulator transcription factor [Betaproteobacteria bacterium]|nr:response regulator transcription factor [Betaproteobacteria bacterium]